ncbi:MAG TPA: UDP-N-acetylglucosamine 2-epimerase (non-hydrolyzing) [Acidimicrobiia bacterium]|nr:UDP-N-acetylglucosamine 2-epimerase (non-hydrolyzing) [Acidimicrobiia bacterium]
MPPALPPASVAVVLGTRPEIVKLGHVIRLLGPAARVVHTGQHFDASLSAVFLEAFGIGAPDVHLSVGGETRGRQIGIAVGALDEHFGDDRPLAVVGQGDTNSTLAAALAANAREIPLVHVEAGLRSRDRRMPEEHNRVVTDHLADLCCAPTETSRGNLRSEGIPDDRIAVTGNTVVEAVTSLQPDHDRRQDLLGEYRLEANAFVLSTFHRPENVDDPATLRSILESLAALPIPVVLPMHPRTRARVERFGLGELLASLRVTEPIGYVDFLGLAASSAMLISDSGGVQEEASVIKRPVLVVRRSTERPEVLGTFAERVEPGPSIGEVATAWWSEIDDLHARLAGIPSPYGDGTASEQTVAAIAALVG